MLHPIVDRQRRRPASVSPSSISNTWASSRPDTRISASSSAVFTMSGDHRLGRAASAAAICAFTMSWKLSVGLASASMPIFIQNSACALIERHMTVLARRTSS
jgi:hypothetical protein